LYRQIPSDKFSYPPCKNAEPLSRTRLNSKLDRGTTIAISGIK